ncbi:MAG TPA: Uma2 family endonuclease, partial [Polyangium sp.]|nr:Uma2 family endonuclease [Polyangium sp.]
MPAVPMQTSEGPDEIDYSGFVIEDDTPVDNIVSEKQQRLLTEPLYSIGYAPPLREDGVVRPFLANSNVGLFAIGEKTAIVPDVMLSVDVKLGLDRRNKKNLSYFVSALGKVPDVVIEVVSNDEGEELTGKRRRYARMKIPHYIVWDPEKIISKTPLRIFELRGDLLVPSKTSFFPELGLGVCVWKGAFEKYEGDWLRWCTEDGAVVPTGAELAAKAKALVKAAKAQANAQQARADAQQARADAQQARADAQQARADA